MNSSDKLTLLISKEAKATGIHGRSKSRKSPKPRRTNKLKLKSPHITENVCIMSSIRAGFKVKPRINIVKIN